jgi:hypothetical protein
MTIEVTGATRSSRAVRVRAPVFDLYIKHSFILYSALRTSSLSLIPNADAKAFATSIPTLTFPSSMELMYVR